MLWLFGACLEASPSLEPPSCDPRILESGELRARARECADEAIPNGEGRRGEWLLENSMLRAAVRAAPNALTIFHASGGGIVDLATADGNDLLHEIIPLINDAPIERSHLLLESTEEQASVTLNSFTDDSVVKYWIEPDTPKLQFDGHDSLLIVPDAGFRLEGQMLIHPDHETVIAFDGPAVDLEGHIVLSANQIAVDQAQTVWKWLDPNTLNINVRSESDFFNAYSNTEQLVGQFNVNAGQFEGSLPSTVATLRGGRLGCALGPAVPITSDSIPEPTDCAKAFIRVQDHHGQSLFAQLSHSTGTLLIPPNGRYLNKPELLSEVIVSAGPHHEIVHFDLLDPTQDDTIDITLHQATNDYLIFSPLAQCSPATESRETADVVAQQLASKGIDFAICSAEQMVPEAPNLQAHTQAEIDLWPGSHTSAPFVLAWPWYQTLRDAGYGAIPPDIISKDQLDYAAKTGRNTMVDVAWTLENPPPWDTPPDFLLLQEPSDLERYRNLLTQRVPVIPLGALNHCINLSDVPWHPVDIERELRRMHTAIGNGPIVLLTTQGGQNGDLLPQGSQRELHIELETPRWMVLEELTLWSNDRLLQSWSIEGQKHIRYTLRGQHEAITAVVTGYNQTDNSLLWGMSSPILFSNTTEELSDTGSESD